MSESGHISLMMRDPNAREIHADGKEVWVRLGEYEVGDIVIARGRIESCGLDTAGMRTYEWCSQFDVKSTAWRELLEQIERQQEMRERVCDEIENQIYGTGHA